jgi:hypothetical protein
MVFHWARKGMPQLFSGFQSGISPFQKAADGEKPADTRNGRNRGRKGLESKNYIPKEFRQTMRARGKRPKRQIAPREIDPGSFSKSALIYS